MQEYSMRKLFREVSKAAIIMCMSTPALDAQATGPIEKATASHKTDVLLEHGKEHKYEFADDELVMYGIDAVKLLLQSRVNGSLYVLPGARRIEG
jgi:hypothetical protein